MIGFIRRRMGRAENAMASAAEQLASNLNFGAFAKAEDLKKRIWFTLGALLVYRLGTYIPLPGINPDAFAQAFQGQAGGILGLFNMFAGGAVERMAIFALGIMPYISASIIIQLMTSVIPTLEQLKKEGEQGRKIINQYTRYGTVLLGHRTGLRHRRRSGIGHQHRHRSGLVLPHRHRHHACRRHHVPDVARRTDHGARHRQRHFADHLRGHRRSPAERVAGTLELGRTGALSTGLIIAIIIVAIAVIAFIVFIERAQRQLLIQYPKRQVGSRMFQGDTSHLPLKLNTAGVIPPIFASSLLLLPATIAGFSNTGDLPGWATTLLASLGPRPAGLHGVLCLDDRASSPSSTRRSCSIRRTPPTISSATAVSSRASVPVRGQPSTSTSC
jgi:preprotein translocase subunit SecY